MASYPAGRRATPPAAVSTLPPPLEPNQPQMEVAPWLGGTVFWIIMVLLLGYAAYIYLSGKGVQFGWLQAWWDRLRQSWLMLRQSFGQWRTSTLADDQDAQNEKKSGFDWLRPLRGLRRGEMDPSQRVRYLYLSMLQEAEDSGVARRPGETPTRYAPRLEDALSDDERPVQPSPRNSSRQFAARLHRRNRSPILARYGNEFVRQSNDCATRRAQTVQTKNSSATPSPHALHQS
ncbi:MAG: DUF4129 domain-containing protein [Caldilineaceae bacterium]